MKLAEARKLFTLPTLTLRDGVLIDAEGDQMSFFDGMRPEKVPPFKTVQAARRWLAARGYLAEVA